MFPSFPSIDFLIFKPWYGYKHARLACQRDFASLRLVHDWKQKGKAPVAYLFAFLRTGNDPGPFLLFTCPDWSGTFSPGYVSFVWSGLKETEDPFFRIALRKTAAARLINLHLCVSKCSSVSLTQTFCMHGKNRHQPYHVGVIWGQLPTILYLPPPPALGSQHLKPCKWLSFEVLCGHLATQPLCW